MMPKMNRSEEELGENFRQIDVLVVFLLSYSAGAITVAMCGFVSNSTAPGVGLMLGLALGLVGLLVMKEAKRK